MDNTDNKQMVDTFFVVSLDYLIRMAVLGG